jgi:hypothetical protein
MNARDASPPPLLPPFIPFANPALKLRISAHLLSQHLSHAAHASALPHLRT